MFYTYFYSMAFQAAVLTADVLTLAFISGENEKERMEKRAWVVA